MAEKRTFIVQGFDMSYEETKKGWSMPYSHHHTHYEIYILLSGKRIVTIGDHTYPVAAGYATLFDSNISHRSVGNTDYSGICIHLSKEFLSRYFLPEAVTSLLSCFKTPIIYIPEEYREKIIFWNSEEIWKSPSSYLLLAQILTDLTTFSQEYKKETCLPVSSNKASGPLRIVNYIDANYTDIQCIEDIATSCGVSTAYVHRAVKQLCHMTVKEYINQHRMRHAIHLMEYRENTISSIARTCGFQNVPYFHRLFKKSYGISPLNYRNKITESSQ